MILDVTPGTVRAGFDAAVTLRGLNLPAGATLQVGSATVPAALADGPLQTLTAIIPASTLAVPGEISIRAVDPENPGEEPSNALRLKVE